MHTISLERRWEMILDEIKQGGGLKSQLSKEMSQMYGPKCLYYHFFVPSVCEI